MIYHQSHFWSEKELVVIILRQYLSAGPVILATRMGNCLNHRGFKSAIHILGPHSKGYLQPR